MVHSYDHMVSQRHSNLKPVLQANITATAMPLAMPRARHVQHVQQLLGILLMYTKLMPFIILLLTCCSFLIALTWDLIWGAELFREWVFWLYGHWEDSCNQPIGPLQQWFWIILWVKIFVLASLAKWNDEGDRPWMKKLFWCVLNPLAMIFDLGWPTVTFICLCYAHADCSKILRQSCWLLLTPYLLQVFVALFAVTWPHVKRRRLPNDPANLLRDFQLRLVPAKHCDSCSICLADILDNQSVVVPCENEQHVFHSACLAGWLQTSQSRPTCPLCRNVLKRKRRIGSQTQTETNTGTSMGTSML